MYLWIGEIFVSFITALAALFFFVKSGSFRDLSTNPMDVGSRAFPKMMALLLLLFALWQMIHAVRKTKASGDRINFGNIPTVASGAILIAIYIFLFKKIGYFYVTPVFIFLLQWIQGSRKWIIMTAISIGFSLFAYIIFVRFLGVALP